MTAVLDAPAGLATLSDDELTAMYAGADDATQAALVGECNRRDRAARIAAARKRAADRRQALYAEWREWAHADYLAAEARCAGNLLSREGSKHCEEPMRLWSLPEHTARLWGSEELNSHWDEADGHMTFARYLRQRATSRRIDRDQHAMESSSNGRNGAAPATGSTSPHTCKPSGNRPVMQAKQAAAGSGMRGNMDTIEQRAAALQPGDLATKSAARKDRMNRARDRAGIPRPPAGTVALRPAAALAGGPPQIDGAALLGYVRGFIGRFTYLSPAQADAVALWIGHTHARDEDGYLSWAASPRLYALSSKPGSGKSTLLEHCGRLCPATFGLDTEPTEAGLVYTISKEHATVLLDEGDVLFASGRRKAAVRAIINSGYTPNGTTLKIKAGKGERVRIFGALALAALDVVEKATGGTMEATMTRGVPVRMTQAPEGYDIPEMTRTDEANAAKLRLVLEKWGTGNRDEMAGLAVEVPDGIRNRQAQIWKTLLRVGLMADITHQRVVDDMDAVPPGGSWYERAFAACQALALAGADDDAERTADMMDELAADLGGWDTGGEL